MTQSKLFARFATDTNLEEAGVWTDFGDGIRVRIRRIRSQKSMDVRKELERPHTADLRRGPLSDKVQEDLLLKQMAAAIIADWEGVTDKDGKVLAFTADNAYGILKALPEFRDAILQVSVDSDAYRVRSDEEAVENLSPTSAGV